MDKFTARRRILRGSMSAPLVLTVASPAALARQSFEACLFRAGQDPAEGLQVFIGEQERDTWLRATVEIYRGTLKRGANATVVGSPPGITSPVEDLPGVRQPVTAEGQAGIASSGQAPGGGPPVDPPGDPPEHEFYLLEGRYYPVDQAEEERSAGHVAEEFVGEGPRFVEKRRGLVYVDAGGNLAGFGPNQAEDGFPVSGSCWASFEAGKQA